MDQFKNAIIMKKVEKTMKNLERNNMKAYYVETKEALLEQVQQLVKPGETITCGGSMTLFETGIMDHLRSGKYRLLDRYTPDLTPEQIRMIFVEAFDADAYFCSSNAITEGGELYNIDGNSNRVAAMLFGPSKVIVIAGINKLVKNLEEAEARLRSIAAPANAARLSCKTPCVETGQCSDCKSEYRICCNKVVMAQQRQKDRIHVILVGQEFGY